MSSDEQYAIRCAGVGKEYYLGTTTRESLVRSAGDVLMAPFRKRERDTFWALKDITFDIKRGEVVGLIGRNGAGKSTLLKLLSRITEPTVGTIDLWGRIGSLLEVGTGFHPELTGRENVFLNGSILGMTKAEIERKFDQIVEFSGVERFLDTPVKRYSSGMFVRLAFSVAAHLEPEVLIVDEVLSVGDADFQRRCMAKMQEVAGHGRTVLFVSHNLGMMRQLCKRGLLLQGGQIIADGLVDETIGTYLNGLADTSKDAAVDRGGSGGARLTSVRLLKGDEPVQTVMTGDDLTVELEYENGEGFRSGSIVMNLYDEAGTRVTTFDSILTDSTFQLGREGTLRCTIDRLPLALGNYRLAIGFDCDGRQRDLLHNAASFQVASSVYFPTGRSAPPGEVMVYVDHAWNHVAADKLAEAK